MEDENNIFRKYSYLWVTLAFFLLSLIGHWFFAWKEYVSEQETHNEEVKVEEYVEHTLNATFENWQSEFLQLMWQVGGLAFLLYVGSPQSKESDERIEAKIDMLLKKLDPSNSKKVIKELDKKYYKQS